MKYFGNIRVDLTVKYFGNIRVDLIDRLVTNIKVNVSNISPQILELKKNEKIPSVKGKLL